MRQLTCAGIFSEVKLSEWSHTPQSLIMSTHAGFTGKYLFQIWYATFGALTQLHPSIADCVSSDISYTDLISSPESPNSF